MNTYTMIPQTPCNSSTQYFTMKPVPQVSNDGAPALDLDVKELGSGENITVEAEVATPDMAVAGEVAQPWAGGQKGKDSGSLTNLKPIDAQRLQRLLKMGKKSRKPEYPGETVKFSLSTIPSDGLADLIHFLNNS